MDTASVVVDTGPLVAWLNRRDRYHDWAREQFETLVPPLLTCEAVLCEGAHILSRAGSSGSELVALLRRGVLNLAFDLEVESTSVEKLMRRYRNVPMSLADACIVRMSELHKDSRVFTNDSDFRVYRRNTRQVIGLICPEGM